MGNNDIFDPLDASAFGLDEEEEEGSRGNNDVDVNDIIKDINESANIPEAEFGDIIGSGDEKESNAFDEEGSISTENVDVNVPISEEYDPAIGEADVSSEEKDIVEKEEKNLDEIEKSEGIETPSASTWIIPLADVHEYQIDEFALATIKWIRVKDPEGQYTDKFAVFCKKFGEEEWSILNGLLSGRYQAVSLNSFVNSISSVFDLLHDPEIRFENFKSAWIADLNSPVSVFDHNSAKAVFSIVTGVSIESLDNVDTIISAIITNSYDGKAKLSINYALKTSVIIPGEDNLHSFRDYFTLSNYSERVSHSMKLESIRTNINEMSSNIQSAISQLKSIPVVGNDLIENIAGCYPSDGKKMLLAIWENTVPDLRNLFWIAIISSIVLDSHFALLPYFRVRTIINNTIQRSLLHG